MNNPNSGVELTLPDLAELGIKKADHDGSITYYIGPDVGQYYVFLDNDEGRAHLKEIHIDLISPFGEGFPKGGFNHSQKCDDHYLEFRFLYEVARRLAKQFCEKHNVAFAIEDDYDGDEIIYGCPKLVGTIKSKGDVALAVQLVREFDGLKKSPWCVKAIQCLRDSTAAELERLSNQNI